MPHFSRSRIKMRKDVRAVDMHGEPVEYRGIAFLQFRTEWNDTTRSFKPMTPQQKQICEDLYLQLAEAGVELGITITERVPGVEDVRQFPKVMSFQLMVNRIDGSAPMKSNPIATPTSDEGAGNGW